jgi:hypothetical protein
VPVVLGGDHSVAWPVASALAEYRRDRWASCSPGGRSCVARALLIENETPPRLILPDHLTGSLSDVRPDFGRVRRVRLESGHAGSNVARSCGGVLAEFLIVATDMSLPRPVLPGQFYMITRRCTQRQLSLRPDPATNNAFTYCLIEAAQRCEIDVLLPCAMSNHYHAVIFDRYGRYPEFVEHFH